MSADDTLLLQDMAMDDTLPSASRSDLSRLLQRHQPRGLTPCPGDMVPSRMKRTAVVAELPMPEHVLKVSCRYWDRPSVRAPLAEPKLLDLVFGYTGVKQFLFVAGVCREWRGAYLT